MIQSEVEDCTFKPQLVSHHHSRLLSDDIDQAIQPHDYQTIQPVRGSLDDEVVIDARNENKSKSRTRQR